MAGDLLIPSSSRSGPTSASSTRSHIGECPSRVRGSGCCIPTESWRSKSRRNSSLRCCARRTGSRPTAAKSASESAREPGVADQHAVRVCHQAQGAAAEAAQQCLAVAFARRRLLADEVPEHRGVVVVADQHLGVEFIEPLQAHPRLPASVEQVAGEHQVIDARAKPRTSHSVLEELGERVHVRDDQREGCRRPQSAFPRCLLMRPWSPCARDMCSRDGGTGRGGDVVRCRWRLPRPSAQRAVKRT